MLGRYQHQTLVTMGELSVDDVRGRSVGVRSWSQTTGVWLRGFLSEQYGIDLTDINWQHIRRRTRRRRHRPGMGHARTRRRLIPGSTSSKAGSTTGSWATSCPPTTGSAPPFPTRSRSRPNRSARKGFAPINHVVGFSAAAANEDPEGRARGLRRIGRGHCGRRARRRVRWI